MFKLFDRHKYGYCLVHFSLKTTGAELQCDVDAVKLVSNGRRHFDSGQRQSAQDLRKAPQRQTRVLQVSARKSQYPM